MKNMTKCFLVMVSLVAGSFHRGWAMQNPRSENEERILNEERLILAAIKGDSAKVDKLLKIGVNANNAPGVGRALIGASSSGHTEIVRMLLAVDGIDVNAQDDWNVTALMEASYWGHTEIVRLLLDADADITLKNKGGKTALDLAREKGNIEIVKLLENIIAVKTRIKEIAADEWQDLPLEVRDAYIMPFLDPDQK